MWCSFWCSFKSDRKEGMLKTDAQMEQLQGYKDGLTAVTSDTSPDSAACCELEASNCLVPPAVLYGGDLQAIRRRHKRTGLHWAPASFELAPSRGNWRVKSKAETGADIQLFKSLHGSGFAMCVPGFDYDSFCLPRWTWWLINILAPKWPYVTFPP